MTLSSQREDIWQGVDLGSTTPYSLQHHGPLNQKMLTLDPNNVLYNIYHLGLNKVIQRSTILVDDFHLMLIKFLSHFSFEVQQNLFLF